jgi:hypothetical protein
LKATDENALSIKMPPKSGFTDFYRVFSIEHYTQTIYKKKNDVDK